MAKLGIVLASSLTVMSLLGVVAFLLVDSKAENTYEVQYKAAELGSITPDETVNQDNVEDTEIQMDTPESNRLNVLVLGVDSRSEEITGRSDAMMVLSIDKTTETLTMLSIPRDAYVDIAGKGKKDKITHAFNDGIDVAKETVEDLLDIEFDHHVVLNFSAFTKVIDAMGGVEVDVPFNFSEQDSKGTKNAISFTKGKHTLNGEEALAYSRMRKSDPEGDGGRVKRQQEVVQAIIKKAVSFSSLPKVKGIYTTTKSSVQTDVNVFDIPALMGYATTFKEAETYSLKGDGVRIRGIYYLELDNMYLEEIKQKLK